MTATLVGRSEPARPDNAMQMGQASAAVATTESVVTSEPPRACEPAASSVEAMATRVPRSTRSLRLGARAGADPASRVSKGPPVWSTALSVIGAADEVPGGRRRTVNLITVSDSNPISPEAVDAAVAAALAAFESSDSVADLKRARAEHAGEASAIAQLNALMRQVPKDEKAATGKLMGQARGRIEGAYKSREATLAEAEAQARLVAETVDVTAAPVRRVAGTRHPLAQLQDDIADVFVGMGWEVAEGPELEHEWFNFDALGFDPDHPARAMQDTFFVEPAERHLVLRTHTSPVQIRALLGEHLTNTALPLYVVAPGRVYRTDELDATHTPVFHQVEGIAIDRGLTMAHLRGTLEHFARQMFGEGAEIRLRPNFFPFTEPSAEMDVWQPHAKGGARWVEWGGCGMVDPNVLAAAGVDPEEYQGFAFGMGIERTLQFRHDLSDMRDMVEGDIRFNSQFGGLV